MQERAEAFARGEWEVRRIVQESLEASGANWTQASWGGYVDYLNGE